MVPNNPKIRLNGYPQTETGLKGLNEAGQGNLGNGNAATTWMSYLMAWELSQSDPDIAEIFMLWDSAPQVLKELMNTHLYPH